MIRNILLTIIAVNLTFISYYARKSCQLEPTVADPDIRIEQPIDKLESTLNYAAQLLNVIPDTKVNGKYIVAANKGFIGRVINQMRRDYPRCTASREVTNYGLWQIQWQYICWQNYQHKRAIAEIDDLATASL